MKVKPFEYNVRNKIVPMSQSILIRHGEHVPTLFVYDKNGIEKILEFDLLNDEKEELNNTLNSVKNTVKETGL